MAEHDGVCAVATAVLDGRVVVLAGGIDATVRVWDLATGRQLGPALTGHADRWPSAPAAT